MQKMGASLIGAPTDVGASVIGTRMGPEALRVAGIAEAITRFDVDVRDVGNLAGRWWPGTSLFTLPFMLSSPPDACRCCSAATTRWRSDQSVL